MSKSKSKSKSKSESKSSKTTEDICPVCKKSFVGGYLGGGFNSEGEHNFTERSYDEFGFFADGTHSKTGKRFDPCGWDWRGFDRSGVQISNGTLWDYKGFDAAGIHKKTGTSYNEAGLDWEEFGADGYSAYGIDRDRYYRSGREWSAWDDEPCDDDDCECVEHEDGDKTCEEGLDCECRDHIDEG